MRRTWIQALSAEADEFETGRARLAWAWVLPLVLGERRAAMGRAWRSRLLWLASAGGLGGLRVFGPGVACGIVMMAWSYAHRGEDARLPLFAAFVLAPAYVLRGLLAARGRTVSVGALVGAVTAVLGFEIVVLGTAVYVAATESWLKAALYLGFGLGYVIPVAVVGTVCGLAGGALAHPKAIISSSWWRQ